MAARVDGFRDKVLHVFISGTLAACVSFVWTGLLTVTLSALFAVFFIECLLTIPAFLFGLVVNRYPYFGTFPYSGVLNKRADYFCNRLKGSGPPKEIRADDIGLS